MISGGNFNLANLGTLNRSNSAVNLTGTLNLGGGALTLDAITGSWSLVGGTLTNGTLHLTNGATLIPTSLGGRLSGVTLNGNLDLANNNALVRISGVNTLNGIVTIGGAEARLASEGHATLRTDGGGAIFFTRTNSNFSHLSRDGAGSLTIGPGLLVHGGRATIGDVLSFGGNFSLTNYGTILADASGQALNFDANVNPLVNFGVLRAINGGSLSVANLSEVAGLEITGGGNLTVGGTWRNTGALTVNNSTLTLSGNWTNAGAINFTNATLELGGNFNLADLGTLNRSSSDVNLTGTLNLDGGALTLDAITGSWALVRGTLTNGTVNLINGAALIPTSSGGRLSAITLNGNLGLATNNALVRISGVNTLNGIVTIGGGEARLASEGHTALRTDGGGAIFFTRTNSNFSHLSRDGAGSLTIGPGLLVHGGRATIGDVLSFGGNFSLTNYGTILADASGQALNFDLNINPLVNFGTLGASDSSLTLGPLANNSGTLLAGTNAVVAISGGMTQNATGVVEVHVAGTATNRFGRVSLTGAASLAGTLRAMRPPDYVPSPGNRFRFMTFASRTGLFDAVEGTTIEGGLTLNLDSSDPIDLELLVTGP